MGNSISTATTVQALEYTEYSVRDRIMFGSYAEDVINAISEYFKLQLTLLKVPALYAAERPANQE